MRALIKRSVPSHPNAEPNVIPFIDVLLVLLVIFMVTAPKSTVDLQLQLPGPNPTPMHRDVVMIELRDGGGGGALVSVDGVATTMAELPRAALARGVSLGQASEDVLDEMHFMVRAEQDIAYAHVVSAIDSLQHAGFAKVGVFSQSADET
ncbi:MAG: biopolymer transporter ExbD [Hyphomonadaceae bacterium]|nr:biopolymer transporter ExbD [Hyphomonadaceae bacterium]